MKIFNTQVKVKLEICNTQVMTNKTSKIFTNIVKKIDGVFETKNESPS